jgi:hypothetical protein
MKLARRNDGIDPDLCMLLGPDRIFAIGRADPDQVQIKGGIRRVRYEATASF